MASIIKDIGEIWTRLFDHRPFLNGEIKFILREFEEKRGDREIERLFESLQNLTEIRYTQIDKIKAEGEANLVILKNKLDESLLICNRILEKEKNYLTNINLKQNQEIRRSKLQSLNQEISEKCAKVDKVFDEEEKKLQNHYQNLEGQFHLPVGFHS